MGPRLEDFDIIGTIGRGAHGTVRKVKRKSDGKVMVWKELDYGAMSEAEKQGLVLEVNLLRELRHPNIVRFIQHMIHKRTTTLYILMEYCPGGDLKYLIGKCKHTGSFLEEGFIWRILKQVCEALHACHSRQLRGGRLILHRDIKPANIFLDSDGNVKLGDFGLARTLSSDTSFATTCVGTPYYMSPEVVDGREYNEKSDIWSLGCLIYELCALHPPFQGANQKDLAAKIKRVKYENIPVHYSSDMQAVIDFMLIHEDFLRPTAFMILHYPALVKHTRTKEEIDEELLSLSTNPSLAKTESSIPKVTTQAEIHSSASPSQGEDKLKKDAEGIRSNSVYKTGSDEQIKTEAKAECIYPPSCENVKESKGLGSCSLNMDVVEGKGREGEEQKTDRKKMELCSKIGGKDNSEYLSRLEESHSKGCDNSSFVRIPSELEKARISGVSNKQSSTSSETLAKDTIKMHSHSDKSNFRVHSSSGAIEKQKQLVSPCAILQTFVSSPTVPKQQVALDFKADVPSTRQGEDDGWSRSRRQQSSQRESMRKSNSVPSSPRKANRLVDSQGLKPFCELSEVKPRACRKLAESVLKQECSCGGTSGEEWRIRLANLREAEVNLRMRELAVEERERELARREKKVVSMEREAREHLVRAQIYLRQARPRNSSGGMGAPPVRPPSDLDTTMSADPGDVFPPTVAKLDPTRITNPFLSIRGISPPLEKHVTFEPKDVAVPFKSNTLDNPKSRRKRENIFGLVERMAELNLDSEVIKVQTPVVPGNNPHVRTQTQPRARNRSTSSLDQDNVESLMSLSKQTDKGSEPALSQQHFPDSDADHCVGLAKKRMQRITNSVDLPNTSKPKIKSAMPWTRRPGTDLGNVAGGWPKKKPLTPKRAQHWMKSPALDKENVVGSPSRKSKRPDRASSFRQRFLHRMGSGKKATGHVPCGKTASQPEEPQSVAVGSNKVLHFYNVM